MTETQNLEEVDFSTDTDSDLLGYMAMREDEPQLATQAWGEFYHRHVRYVWGVLWRLARGRCQKEDLENLVQDVFCRVFEKAETFYDRGNSDSAAVRKLTRGWLGAIAKNLLWDLLRGEEISPESLDESVSATMEAPESGRKIPSELAKLLAEALDEVLDEREREVLRVTAEYLKPGETFQRLPSGVGKRLAADLNTTTTNIRMIRRKAKGKIRRYVHERQKQQEQS